MNPILKLHDWVKTLPPAMQTLYYSLEAAVIAGVGFFLYQIYTYALAKSDLQGFPWAQQWHILYISITVAAIKALVDLFKFSPPTQEPPQKGP